MNLLRLEQTLVIKSQPCKQLCMMRIIASGANMCRSCDSDFLEHSHDRNSAQAKVYLPRVLEPGTFLSKSAKPEGKLGLERMTRTRHLSFCCLRKLDFV